MAAYNKFDAFVFHLGGTSSQINLGADTFNVALFTSANAPDGVNDGSFDTVTNHSLSASHCTEVASGNGYTAGGIALTTATSQSAGVLSFTWTGAAPTWTASGSGFTFRYIVLYDATANVAATRFLIAYWDWGIGGLTLVNGSQFTFSPSSAVFTVGP